MTATDVDENLALLVQYLYGHIAGKDVIVIDVED